MENKHKPEQGTFVGQHSGMVDRKSILGAFSDRLAEDSRIYTNTAQDFIVISEDRLEIYVRDYEKNILGGAGLEGYAGVAISLLIALFTCHFEDTFGIRAEMIRNGFLISFGGICVFLGQKLYERYKQRAAMTARTSREFVEKCKSIKK